MSAEREKPSSASVCQGGRDFERGREMERKEEHDLFHMLRISFISVSQMNPKKPAIRQIMSFLYNSVCT